MKSYNSRELIRILKKNVWVLKANIGSHNYFENPERPDILIFYFFIFFVTYVLSPNISV